jgi:subtilisin family serine protease
MTATTHRRARFWAALVGALIALAIAAPLAAGSPTSRPPKLSGTRMHWYHWHPSARSLQARAAKFGSTAVLGLESMNDLSALRAAYGFDRVRAIPKLHAAEVSVDAGQLQALLANARTDQRIRYVSPIGPPRKAMSMPNDPFLHMIDPGTGLPYEWAFAASNVPRALDISQGDPRIVVGVVDTGIADVPDLAGKIDSLWTIRGTEISQSPDGNDDFGHGTAVTSLIAANVDDGFGMAGFAGATHVIGVHASEGLAFFDASVAIALTKLGSLGVRIVNMSLGGTEPSDPILLDAIHKAAADGILLVASSGNEERPSGHVSWPAADLQPAGGGRSYGLSVGATTVDAQPAGFSSWGKHLSLVAPGDYGRGRCTGLLVAIPSTSAFDESCFLTWAGEGGARYGNLAGTSFAAPEVTGIAALIWAARPELENYQVADIIKQSARREAGTDWTPTMGCGILDAGAALELATSRAAFDWEEPERAGDAVCSAVGDEAPTWPGESNQTITFDPIPNKKLGDSDFLVHATASSRLPVWLTVAGGNCILTGRTVHLTGAGSCSITASQSGDSSYNLATSVSRTFLIEDVAPRSVHALATSGTRGASVNLLFRVGKGNGDVAVKITVQRNRTTVARLDRNFFRVEPGHVYALAWRAPESKTAVYRFCVSLVDRPGRETGPSCERIRLR